MSVEEAQEPAEKGSQTASEKEETNEQRDGMYKNSKNRELKVSLVDGIT